MSEFRKEKCTRCSKEASKEAKDIEFTFCDNNGRCGNMLCNDCYDIGRAFCFKCDMQRKEKEAREQLKDNLILTLQKKNDELQQVNMKLQKEILEMKNK